MKCPISTKINEPSIEDTQISGVIRELSWSENRRSCKTGPNYTLTLFHNPIHTPTLISDPIQMMYGGSLAVPYCERWSIHATCSNNICLIWLSHSVLYGMSNIIVIITGTYVYISLSVGNLYKRCPCIYILTDCPISRRWPIYIETDTSGMT